MAYVAWMDMNVTDYAVVQAIQNMKTDTFTRDDIAAEARCTTRTLTRAFARLMASGILTVQRIPNTRRYRYIINEELIT